MNLSWNGPESDGGGSVKSYLIEYDISPTFNGHSLIQYSVLETDADASVEKILFAYPHHSDYDFRNRIILANSDIIHNGIIQEGTKLTIEKKNYSVLRLNNNGCGVSCITLTTAFIGTETAGIKVFSGLNTKEYSHIIDGLIPGIKYFVRISAATIYGIQSPFAFVEYPRTAVGLLLEVQG